MSGMTEKEEMELVHFFLSEKKPDIELSGQLLELKSRVQALEKKFPEKVRAIRDRVAAI